MTAPRLRRASMPFRWTLCFAAILAGGTPEFLSAQPAPVAKPKPLKVVLAGDAIRIGYGPLVAKRLEGKLNVVSPPADGGDSAELLQKLDDWLIREQPDIIHFSCGLRDLGIAKASKMHQVEPAQYEANLRKIVGRLKKEAKAALVFANTTPVLDERCNRGEPEFKRFEADVQRYNATALAIMKEAGIPVHDLHWVVAQGGLEQVLAADGVHLTAAGSERLAEAVADCLLRQATLVRYPGGYSPTAPTTVSPQAAERYRKLEKERDAQVPAASKKLAVGSFHQPAAAAEWTRQRPDVLKTVVGSLGDIPARPLPQRTRIITRELRPGYTLERIAIDNGEENEVTALLLLPEKRQTPAPAILWLHSSTPDKNQIISRNTNGGADSLERSY